MTEEQKVFGARLKAARTSRGLSQEDMANFLGVGTQKSYSRYENGKLPPMSKIVLIASRLSVGVSDLLGRSADPEGGAVVEGNSEEKLELRTRGEDLNSLWGDLMRLAGADPDGLAWLRFELKRLRRRLSEE